MFLRGCSMKFVIATALLTLIALPVSAEETFDSVVIDAEQLALGDNEEGQRATASENNVINTQTLTSTVTGNTINVTGDMINGAVNIGDFGSGIGSYVMNTGNNSSINSAVSISIQMLPSP